MKSRQRARKQGIAATFRICGTARTGKLLNRVNTGTMSGCPHSGGTRHGGGTPQGAAQVGVNCSCARALSGRMLCPNWHGWNQSVFGTVCLPLRGSSILCQLRSQLLRLKSVPISPLQPHGCPPGTLPTSCNVTAGSETTVLVQHALLPPRRLVAILGLFRGCAFCSCCAKKQGPAVESFQLDGQYLQVSSCATICPVISRALQADAYHHGLSRCSRYDPTPQAADVVSPAASCRMPGLAFVQPYVPAINVEGLAKLLFECSFAEWMALRQDLLRQ